MFDRVSPQVAGVWTDDAGIREQLPTQEYAELILARRRYIARHLFRVPGQGRAYIARDLLAASPKPPRTIARGDLAGGAGRG